MRIRNTWHNHQLAALGLVAFSESPRRENSNEAQIQRLRRAIHVAVRTDARLRKRPGVPARVIDGVPQELIDAAAHLADIKTERPASARNEPLVGEMLAKALHPVSTCGPPGEPDDEIPFPRVAYLDAVVHLFAHKDPAWNEVRDAVRRRWVGEPLVKLAERLPPCCLCLDPFVLGALIDAMLGYAPHGHYQLDDPEEVWGWDDSFVVEDDDRMFDQRTRQGQFLKESDARFLAWLRDEAQASLREAVQFQLSVHGRFTPDVSEYFSSERAWERGELTVMGPVEGILSNSAPDLRFVVPDDPLIWEPASSALLRLTGSQVTREAELASLGKAIEEDWRNSCWHRWWESGAIGSDRVEMLLRMYRAESSLGQDSVVRDTSARRLALAGLIDLARNTAMFVEHVCEPVENVEIGLSESISKKDLRRFVKEFYHDDVRLLSRLNANVLSTSDKRVAHAAWTRRCARALRCHAAFVNVVGPLEASCVDPDITYQWLTEFSTALNGVANLDEILREHLQKLADAMHAEPPSLRWDLSKIVLPDWMLGSLFKARPLDVMGWSPAWISTVLASLSADTPPTFQQINRDDLLSEVPSAVALAWILGSMVREVRNALTHGSGFRATAYPNDNSAVWTRPGSSDDRRIIVTLPGVQRLFAMLTWSLSVIDRLDPLLP